MEKQIISSPPIRPINRSDLASYFKNEIASLSQEKLNTQLKKLNYLASNFDPYQGLDISSELINILNEFKLKDFTQDPFEFTNILLQLLDLAQEELNKRLQ